MSRNAFLPYGRHEIDDRDIAAVADALRGDLLTTGPLVDAFEAKLAEAVGAREAVVCANGTAALHLVYSALGLGEGDAVVVPSITFVATANAARYAGAEVVFADVDPATGLMTAETLEAAIRRAEFPIEAVAPVHLGGQPAAMAEIAEVAERYGLRVVEDACHALGSKHGNGTHLSGDCAFSDAACFSFHPVKTIAMGEGGAVTTNDVALATRMRTLRHHAMITDPSEFADTEGGLADDGSRNPWYYEIAELGYNYRATDIQCALGLSQLEKLPRFAARRRSLVAGYRRLLAPYAPDIRMVEAAADTDPCWHLAIALIDFERLGRDRADVMAALKDAGIGSQVHYVPVHQQPYYRRRYGLADLPGAWAYYQQALTLPLFPAMQEADVGRVVAALLDAFAIKERAA